MSRCISYPPGRAAMAPAPRPAPPRLRSLFARRRRLAGVGLAFGCSLMLACPNAVQVPPPDDLEGVLRYIWNQFEVASDAELLETGAVATSILQDLLVAEDAKVGALATLEASDLENFAFDDGRDPTAAPGFFLASRFSCDFDVLADVITHPNQGAVHTGVYDSYARDYERSREDWLSADFGTLSWRVEYEATPTATQYRARTRSAVRRFDVDGPYEGNPTIIQRTYLAEPAAFVGAPDNHVFDQDYQVEVFVQVAAGEILHLYGLWRHMQLGLVGIHDDVFVDFQINGLIEWDLQTEAACEAWPEFPAE